MKLVGICYAVFISFSIWSFQHVNHNYFVCVVLCTCVCKVFFYEIPDTLLSISETNPLSFSHCSNDNEMPVIRYYYDAILLFSYTPFFPGFNSPSDSQYSRMSTIILPLNVRTDTNLFGDNCKDRPVHHNGAVEGQSHITKHLELVVAC